MNPSRYPNLPPLHFKIRVVETTKRAGSHDTMEISKPTIAVTIGSGGLKCIAALPLLFYLRRQNIPIDLLVGCSGGSLVCALFGAGFGEEELETRLSEMIDTKLFSSIDLRVILELFHLPWCRHHKDVAFLSPKMFRKRLRDGFKGKRIEELQPTTVIQLTDYETGEAITVDTGDVSTIVLASSAAYPLLPPVNIAGRWYVDGAFSSPLPILPAVKRGSDIILSIDFSKTSGTAMPASLLGHFNAFVGKLAKTANRAELALAIQMHHHEILPVTIDFPKDILLLDPKKFPEILQIGKRYVQKHGPRLAEEIHLAVEAMNAD